MNDAAPVAPGGLPAGPDAEPGALLPPGPRPQLRTILKLALAEAFPDAWGLAYAEAGAKLAPILTAELARNGYRIHDTRLCIRVPDRGEAGRPMTADELRALPIGQKIVHPRRRLREPNADPGTFSE